MFTNNEKKLEDKDLYIGIKGLISMIVIKTPTYKENSRLVLTKNLFNFYRPKPVIEK